jgi:hypothetical protein
MAGRHRRRRDPRKTIKAVLSASAATAMGLTLTDSVSQEARTEITDTFPAIPTVLPTHEATADMQIGKVIADGFPKTLPSPTPPPTQTTSTIPPTTTPTTPTQRKPSVAPKTQPSTTRPVPTPPTTPAPVIALCKTLGIGLKGVAITSSCEIAKSVGLPLSALGGYRPSAIDPAGHPSGKAVDFTVYSNNAQGDRILQYAFKNWKRLGVLYVIWEQKYYSGPYVTGSLMENRGSITANHWDHVHISFK